MENETGLVKALFKRYLQNKATSAESQLVEDWYERIDYLPDNKPSDSEQAQAAVWHRVENAIAPNNVRPIKQNLAMLLRVAATIFLVFSVGMAIYILGWKPEAVLTSSDTTSSRWQEVSTTVGQHRKLRMKDGTLLVLNSGTTVQIGNDMTRERRVRLIDGEVFFDIARDTLRPFLIESGETTTKVLGTAFNIAYYKRINTYTIDVLRGKVQVYNRKKEIGVLVKQDKLNLNTQTETYNISKSDEDELHWQEGMLVLNNASFEEMALHFEKKYGLYISAGDEHIQHNRYTAKLSAHMDGYQAVEVLASVHSLKVKREGNNIVLYE